MRRVFAVALLVCAAAAGEKRLPSGQNGNEAVSISANVLDSEHLKQIFGTDFENGFVVLEATLIPRGGKPFEVHLDDFLLRSEQTGEHSAALAPSQIAGTGTLVVHQGGEQRSKGGLSGGFGGIFMGGDAMGPGAADPGKSEMKNSEKRDPLLDVLKRKMLAEKPVEETVTGLLFFPLEKEKAKNLNLTVTTPAGKLRMKFK
jgi:hypothetical protein